jgi:dipeptidyl-peptidase-3
VEEAIDRATTPRSAAEFAADEAEAAETIRCALPGGRALAVLRGFVGPEAADPAVPESADDPGEPAGVLAEAWSDLAALHLLRHPLLVELGLLPDEACATAVLRDYVRGTLASLRNSPDDGTMPDALRARLLNVGYAVERGAVRVERSGARTVLRIPDPARWYEVAAERMRSLERIRAGADDEAGRALVEAHGARAPAGWREEAARRALLAGLPPRFAFLPPWLDPVRDERGEAVDARATAPTDLEPLMFSWSAVGTD